MEDPHHRRLRARHRQPDGNRLHRTGAEAARGQRQDRRPRTLRHRLRGDPKVTIKAAIFGASGYAGGELLRLLLDHPKAEPVAVISRSQAGQQVSSVHAHLSRLTDLNFVSELPRGSDEPEVIFLAGGHGYASEVAPALLDTGIPVVDLSADFRLKDPASFERFYGPTPAAFERRGEWVYGLPELFREQISSSRAVASPGCFATASILALAPLWKKSLVADGAPVSVFAITGSDRKSTRLNSSHVRISYAVFCLKKKKIKYCCLSSSTQKKHKN